MGCLRLLLIGLLCATGLSAPLADANAAQKKAKERPAKFIFGSKRTPSKLRPAAWGSYARGCLAGGAQLPESGPGWQAVRLSRNRTWGHPDLIAFIRRLSAQAVKIGWPGLYIADLAQPRGGPMLTGHTSHQIGLDADIWLRKPGRRKLSRRAREGLKSYSVVTRDWKRVNGNWTPKHHQIIKAAASDPAVARIFVNAAIKQQLCDAEPAGAGRAWLRKIRPWWRHNVHFHVRLRCPKGSRGCVNQPPPPAGDGCDKTLAWWFSDEALNPKPFTKPRKPRPVLTLSRLPLFCRTVLEK